VINPSHRPLPDNTQHSQQTDLRPAGFEPAIPAGERPQNQALERVAIRNVVTQIFTPKYPFPESINKNTTV